MGIFEQGILLINVSIMSLNTNLPSDAHSKRAKLPLYSKLCSILVFIFYLRTLCLAITTGFATTSFVVAVLKMNIADVMRSCARRVLAITCTFVQLVLSIAATLVIHPPNVVTLVAFTAIVVKSVRHARDLENQRTNYQVTC